MIHRLLVIDAFADAPFGGNPAAVCLFEVGDEERPAEWMQAVAAEMNLSETAFVRPIPEGFALRWFTPAVEVPLCGHATLASAHALWEEGLKDPDEEIGFETLCGRLEARRRDGLVEIDLPMSRLEEVEPPAEAVAALGVRPRRVLRSNDRGGGDHDYLFELDSEEAVRSASPDFPRLRAAATAGWIVTAPAGSEELDFVSRYFAPAWGVDEDPVTGAAHTSLVPYWSERLDRPEVVGFQASRRGGRVRGRVREDRVLLAGNAVTVLRGELLA